MLEDYATVDVLSDPEIREGIKLYGNWPTIPQLYIDRELVGGSDIVQSMADSGELHELLGVAAPDRTPPTITISDAAAQAIRAGLADAQGAKLHLSIDGQFLAQFFLREARGNEIVARASGIEILLDLQSAQRARGLTIDWVETLQGSGLAIHNPNAPATVRPMSVIELKQKLDEGKITVIDVRPADARARAPFPAAQVLDEDSHDRLAALPKDSPLAFLCHHGNSSRQAAEHFRELGFRELFNVEGGIDAWSREIDPGVPLY
jgi:monothiol glutaredoxin